MGFLIPPAVASLWAAPTAAAATSAAAAGTAASAAAPLTLSNLGVLGGAVTATPAMGAAAGAAAGTAGTAGLLSQAATLSTLASGGLAVAGALKGVPKPTGAVAPLTTSPGLGPTVTNSSLAAQSPSTFLSGTFGGPRGSSPTAGKSLLGQ